MKWIKCSDRLPEARINVLLWYEDTVKFGWMRHDKTTFELESDCCKGQRFHISYVTHWMPLPKGPDAMNEISYEEIVKIYVNNLNGD